jgi:hypothetical protein
MKMYFHIILTSFLQYTSANNNTQIFQVYNTPIDFKSLFFKELLGYASMTGFIIILLLFKMVYKRMFNTNNSTSEQMNVQQEPIA